MIQNKQHIMFDFHQLQNDIQNRKEIKIKSKSSVKILPFMNKKQKDQYNS